MPFWTPLQQFQPSRSSARCYTSISAMGSQQPPEEGSETSFWAAVFTEEPPNILCGVLTGLNLHRFTPHQHLTTNESLTETPLLHQPFHDALPPPLQRLVQRYHTNLNLANVHLRRALDALELLGRQPGAYLRDPDLAAGDLTPPTEAPFPAASGLQPGEPVQVPPAVRHHLPTLPTRALVLQNTSTQTTPMHFTTHQTQQTDIVITPPLSMRNSRPPHAQTVATLPPKPTSTLLSATPHSRPAKPSQRAALRHHLSPQTSLPLPPQPTATPPNITSAANKQPNPDHWQYAELMENPPPPALPSVFTAPIGGTPRRAPKRRHGLPPRNEHASHKTATLIRAVDPPCQNPALPPFSLHSNLHNHQQLHLDNRSVLHRLFHSNSLPPHRLQTGGLRHLLQHKPPIHALPYKPSTALSRTHGPHTISLSNPHNSHNNQPPLYQQPIFRGEPPPQSQPYQTPPQTPSTPVRVLYDANGRPLPPGQQPYFPEDDPWHADNYQR